MFNNTHTHLGGLENSEVFMGEEEDCACSRP